MKVDEAVKFSLVNSHATKPNLLCAYFDRHRVRRGPIIRERSRGTNWCGRRRFRIFSPVISSPTSSSPAFSFSLPFAFPSTLSFALFTFWIRFWLWLGFWLDNDGLVILWFLAFYSRDSQVKLTDFLLRGWRIVLGFNLSEQKTKFTISHMFVHGR